MHLLYIAHTSFSLVNNAGLINSWHSF